MYNLYKLKTFRLMLVQEELRGHAHVYSLCLS